jgi:hypothetical protein
MKWLELARIFAPLVAAFIPGLAPLSPALADGIQAAEGLAGASSADKLAHATTIARDGIAGLNAAAGRTVVDPSTSDALIGSAISTVVGVTNLVHAAHAAAPAPSTAS